MLQKKRGRTSLYIIIKKEGGWIPVYQQITGITTVVKTLLPETRLVDRFCIAAAAPPVSHHLN